MKIIFISIIVFIEINFFVTKSIQTQITLNFGILRNLNPLQRRVTTSLNHHISRNVYRQQAVVSNNFCNSKTGPGKRSSKRPHSVHQLRPGDIDIIGALGDSLTAGNGILAKNILQVAVENRGIVFTIGGQGNLKQFLTIPNILKEFNPNLYGYSVQDSLFIDKSSSRFNVARIGARSKDLYGEAIELVQRMKSDPNVDINNHWKLLFIFIGNNDFCYDLCNSQHPEQLIDVHEQNMIKTIRFLRDNIPKLMINLIPPPNLRQLTKNSARPSSCYLTLPIECPCLFWKSSKILDYYETIMKKWSKRDIQIAKRDEFNTKTFTVNLQPFTLNLKLFRSQNDGIDFSYFSSDCFHLNQKSHALSAGSLWNNMLQTDDRKSTTWKQFSTRSLPCPTAHRPYLATRVNSKWQ